jgi:hypothetical protein
VDPSLVDHKVTLISHSNREFFSSIRVIADTDDSDLSFPISNNERNRYNCIRNQLKIKEQYGNKIRFSKGMEAN